jgi:uncharacterized protein (TIGR03435 family)
VIRFLASVCLGWMAASAQTPAFEVASVKPNQMSKMGGEGSRREHINISPDTLSMRNVSLSDCIQWAYDVTQYQIQGPGWLNADRFDVVAKAAKPAKEDEIKPMLQSLLADRFQLALHREEKVVQAYVLTVGKNGSKMHQSEGEGEPGVTPIRGKEVVGAQRVPIELMIRLLSQAMRAPVIDQTGLKGKFDFTLDLTGYITKNMQPEDGISAAFTILQEQLGLKLESKKMPVEMLIVDRVERVPTEN